MIELSKIRLINWYGFSNVTVPVGHFTLIAGKNGNGKSVLLDAIKYALYGDTVFNKSTENKGSRTIASYTRGLLDATAGSYMRPADKVPNVYTHIVMEMHDKELDKYVLLGTVIETNSANGFITQRYIMEDRHLEDVEHTYIDSDVTYIYSGSELQKKYGLKMMSVTEGLSRFMQRTGLRLNDGQLAAFRRKLRSIMSYDPDAKIDEFIRENVLEERKFDFTKLIDTKSNIDKLTDTFKRIDDEINELEAVLACFDTLKKAEDSIFTDDVKIEYQNFLKYDEEFKSADHNMIIAKKQIDEDEKKIEIIKRRNDETRRLLDEALRNLNNMDCAKAIQNARATLKEAENYKINIENDKKQLEELQNRINELIVWVEKENYNVPDKNVLGSLLKDTFSSAEKEKSVDELIKRLKDIKDTIHSTITRIKDQIEKNNIVQNDCQIVIDNCKSKITTFSEIPDYVALKNKINKEFKNRGIQSEARFACEYVLELTNESWRDVIEGYLGRRRYTILVEPEYYDMADDILNSTRNTDAHLFNTKLLMKKEISVADDSVVNFLLIKNPVAKKYFDYQLGRFSAVSIDNIRDYENAMSKEGRVSVAMDGFFIKPENVRFYYLGQETVELNKQKAEKKLKDLKEQNQEKKEELSNQESNHSYLDTEIDLFGDYDYDAGRKYNEAVLLQNKRENELQRLIEAQSNNMEFMQLNERVSELEAEIQSIDKEMTLVRDDKSAQQTSYELNEAKYKKTQEDKDVVNTRLNEFETRDSMKFKNAIEEYNRFLNANKTGGGGTLKDRGRAERALREAGENLKGAQAAYNVKRSSDSWLPATRDSRAAYQSRKDKIWMDDRQEIQDKLNEQTRRYEAIFKNEFVLTVLKSCEDAKRELKLINAELSKLSFKSTYQFDVKYIKDGTEYEKILEYARYIKEREELGTSEGQMTFDSVASFSNDDGENLEREIRKIINCIISSDDKEKIERFADYRNYMNYEILVSNEDVLNKAKLSKQSGFNSGAEVQIPYMLILLSALLMVYNDKMNSTRLVFIDEPFAKMDPSNVKIMMDFMKKQNLQMIFCAPDKTELIGNECNVILPVLRTRSDLMEIGIVEMHKGA